VGGTGVPTVQVKVGVKVEVGVPGVQVKVGVRVAVGDPGVDVKVRVGVRVGVLVGVLLRNHSADKSSPGAMGLVWFWLQARGSTITPVRTIIHNPIMNLRIFILLISKGGALGGPKNVLKFLTAAHFKNRVFIRALDVPQGF
jgi:hypothetical protein